MPSTNDPVPGAPSESSSVTTSTLAERTTVTTRQTIEEYSNRRKKAWWLMPLAALGTIPMAFWPSGKDTAETASVDTVVESTLPPAETTVAAVDTTLAAVDTTLAPETTAGPDTTLAPDTTIAPDTTAAAAAANPIPAVAAADASLSKFTAAIGAAGMTDVLNGPGPFTVFAPTDAAFDALPAGALDALLKPENASTLATVLKHHVIAGRIPSADLTAGTHVAEDGSPIAITVDPVRVGGASLVKPDIEASNGLVHSIDTILLPEGLDLSALGAAPAVAGDALTVYFADSSAAIEGDEQAKIDGAVAKLSAMPPGATVKIVGHASVVGSPEMNRRLSLARARNVRNQLRAGLGDKAADYTFTVEARGETEPDVDEAKSRRVTIELVP